MSLDYNYRNIRDDEELHNDELERLISEAIVFHTMGIGLGRITEANWKEFYARIRIVENMHGASLTVPKEVEYNPLVTEPPESTNYVKVNGTLYFYEGVDLWHHEGPVLHLYTYEHNGFSEKKGAAVTYLLGVGDDVITYMDGFEKRPIKPSDVHRRIGLSTNVADETKSKWTKRIMEVWLREGEYRANRYAQANLTEASNG